MNIIHIHCCFPSSMNTDMCILSVTMKSYKVQPISDFILWKFSLSKLFLRCSYFVLFLVNVSEIIFTIACLNKMSTILTQATHFNFVHTSTCIHFKLVVDIGLVNQRMKYIQHTVNIPHLKYVILYLLLLINKLNLLYICF